MPVLRPSGSDCCRGLLGVLANTPQAHSPCPRRPADSPESPCVRPPTRLRSKELPLPAASGFPAASFGAATGGFRLLSRLLGSRPCPGLQPGASGPLPQGGGVLSRPHAPGDSSRGLHFSAHVTGAALPPLDHIRLLRPAVRESAMPFYCKYCQELSLPK